MRPNGDKSRRFTLDGFTGPATPAGLPVLAGFVASEPARVERQLDAASTGTDNYTLSVQAGPQVLQDHR